MRRSKFSESQIVQTLKQVEGGRQVKDVCREFGDFGRYVLRLEVEVRRDGGVGRSAAAGA